jgi:hypothetical protein
VTRGGLDISLAELLLVGEVHGHRHADGDENLSKRRPV